MEQMTDLAFPIDSYVTVTFIEERRAATALARLATLAALHPQIFWQVLRRTGRSLHPPSHLQRFFDSIPSPDRFSTFSYPEYREQTLPAWSLLLRTRLIMLGPAT